ncbi:MAG: LytTR family DNA-binding domain-containing protein [Flavobacteriaceae bacterium]
MKVLIIEDEKPSARRLNRMLNTLDINVTTMLHSVEESILWFSKNQHPDLIFLDIQLSDGLSFEIFEEIDIKSAVIFTTAYDEYALKAFKLNAIDYLLKPIDEEDLKQAIDKFKTYFKSNKSPSLNMESFMDYFKNATPTFKNRFTIKIGQHLKIVNTMDIECFYSSEKATYIHNNSNRNYCIDYSLEQLEDKLDPKQFYRVSRKFYINMSAIKDIISYTNSRLQIKLHNFNDIDIIVSREKVQDFKKWLS